MFSNITFKHRLIGVIFLVSLAVIVIPAIFDTPTVDTLSSAGSLPVAPSHAALEELDKIEYAFSELTHDLPVQEPVIAEP
jgi:cell division septation protein DedD